MTNKQRLIDFLKWCELQNYANEDDLATNYLAEQPQPPAELGTDHRRVFDIDEELRKATILPTDDEILIMASENAYIYPMKEYGVLIAKWMRSIAEQRIAEYRDGLESIRVALIAGNNESDKGLIEMIQQLLNK